MNALQLTALVWLAFIAMVALLGAVAWLHHQWQHRDRSLDAALRRAIWINTWQIGLCCLFGLIIGYVYYWGWCETWP